MAHARSALLASALAASCLLGATSYQHAKAYESLDAVVDAQRGNHSLRDHVADPSSPPPFSARDYTAFADSPSDSHFAGRAIVRFKDGHTRPCDLAFLVPSTPYTQWLFLAFVHRGNTTGQEPGLTFADVVPGVPAYLNVFDHRGLVRRVRCTDGRFGWDVPAGSYYVFGYAGDHSGPLIESPNYEYEGTVGGTQYFAPTSPTVVRVRRSDQFTWIAGPFVVKPGQPVDVRDVDVVGHWAMT